MTDQVNNTDSDKDKVHEPEWHNDDGRHLPKVMDPLVTMQIVQRYIETERNKNRRTMLWISSLFLFVVFLILAVFISIGIFVLKNSDRAVERAEKAEARATVYSLEIVGISNKLASADAIDAEIKGTIEKKEAQKQKEDAKLKSDLERFSRWISENNSQESKTISELKTDMTTLKTQMEQKIKERDEEINRLKTELLSPAAKTVRSINKDLSGDTNPAADVIKQEVALIPVKNDVPESPAKSAEDDFSVPEKIEEIPSLADLKIKIPVPPAESINITVIKFPNGDQYKGTIKNGLFNGWGEYTYKNSDKYEGYFNNDMKCGDGTFFYLNGDKYVGQFTNDQKSGFGTYIFKNGDRYAGDFKNDNITGKGVMHCNNGNRYSGGFKNGLKEGNGIFYYLNGDIYKGEFRDDMRVGRGVYLFADGSKYIGEFKDDKRNGKGRYIYTTGEEYIGQFKDGLKHGEGVCIYPDGKQFKGIWKEDQFIKTLSQ